jgi:hypothetical protein
MSPDMSHQTTNTTSASPTSHWSQCPHGEGGCQYFVENFMLQKVFRSATNDYCVLCVPTSKMLQSYFECVLPSYSSMSQTCFHNVRYISYICWMCWFSFCKRDRFSYILMQTNGDLSHALIFSTRACSKCWSSIIFFEIYILTKKYCKRCCILKKCFMKNIALIRDDRFSRDAVRPVAEPTDNSSSQLILAFGYIISTPADNRSSFDWLAASSRRRSDRISWSFYANRASLPRVAVAPTGLGCPSAALPP